MTTWKPPCRAASSSRSIRFARSSRPTERTKSPYSSQRYGSSCGGCGITSALEPGRALEPVGDVARGGEELARLAERALVELLDAAADRALLGRLAELAELGAVELVRLAELVDEPDDLVRVADDVATGTWSRSRGRSRRPSASVEVEQPPEERLGQHALAGVPLERHGDEVGVVAALAQLGDEVVREDLDAAARERAPAAGRRRFSSSGDDRVVERREEDLADPLVDVVRVARRVQEAGLVVAEARPASRAARASRGRAAGRA